MTRKRRSFSTSFKAKVARAGAHAPGTPNGVNYGDFNNLALLLNSAGQTAFSTSVQGSGVGGGNNQGIWAEDRAGTLRLLARQGDQLEVAAGE